MKSLILSFALISFGATAAKITYKELRQKFESNMTVAYNVNEVIDQVLSKLEKENKHSFSYSDLYKVKKSSRLPKRYNRDQLIGGAGFTIRGFTLKSPFVSNSIMFDEYELQIKSLMLSRKAKDNLFESRGCLIEFSKGNTQTSPSSLLQVRLNIIVKNTKIIQRDRGQMHPDIEQSLSIETYNKLKLCVSKTLREAAFHGNLSLNFSLNLIGSPITEKRSTNKNKINSHSVSPAVSH